MKHLLKSIFLVMPLLFFAVNCGSDSSSGSSGATVSPTTKISLTGITVSSTEITFIWVDPTYSDFDHLEMSYSDGTTSTDYGSIGAGTQMLTVNNLTASTQYSFSVKSIDTTGNTTGTAVFFTNTTDLGSINFTTVSTAEELNNVRNDLAGNYLLVADIDLSSYSPWTPIGDYASDTGNIFTGIFNGNSHTISKLTINTTDDYQGLFGFIYDSAISDVGVIEANISGGAYTGGLVGENRGTVTYSNITGTVNGTTNVGGLVGLNYGGGVLNSYATSTVNGETNVGGLVGDNEGSVSDSYTTGAVSGNDNIGGLVGHSYISTVSNSYTTGAVSGTNIVGGLVGYNEGGVLNSYATGTISGTGTQVGGLVGRNYNYGTVLDSYAIGSVSGTTNVGGLVGYNTRPISNSYATGSVIGIDYVGGLVGKNYDFDYGTVADSYAMGSVSGNSYVGGFAGYNNKTISNSYATGSVSGTDYVGGFLGNNDGGTVTNSFYDAETTGYNDAGGAASSGWTDEGTATSTTDMKTEATFTGATWDFTGETTNGTDDIWAINGSNNDGYPYLTGLADSY